MADGAGGTTMMRAREYGSERGSRARSSGKEGADEPKGPSLAATISMLVPSLILSSMLRGIDGRAVETARQQEASAQSRVGMFI